MTPQRMAWVVCGSLAFGTLAITPTDSEGGWRRAWRHQYYGCYSGYQSGGWQPQVVHTQPTISCCTADQPVGTTWQQPVGNESPSGVQQSGYAPYGTNEGVQHAAPQGQRTFRQSEGATAPPPPVEPNSPGSLEPAPAPVPVEPR
jgi:hypothetical protein